MRFSVFIFFILISLISTPSLAQKKKVKKPFRVWVKSSSGGKMDGLRGPAYLLELKDSSLVFAFLGDAKTNTFLRKEYKVSEIRSVKFRQERIVRRNVLIGALAGFTLGGIIGGIQGGNGLVGPETTTQTIFVYGSILGITTATLLGIAFSLKIKVGVKGNQSNYEKKKETLQKFLVDLEILTESK